MGPSAAAGNDDDNDNDNDNNDLTNTNDKEEEVEEEEALEETWRRYGDELAVLHEMGAQTNELLNIYMSFAMGENPLGKTTTIEQQGHDRHKARCGQPRQHKMMHNANKGLEQERARQDLERVRHAFGPGATASLFNDQAHDATGSTEDPIGWVRGGGGRGGGRGRGGGSSRNSKRSFKEELKRLL